MAFLNCTFNAKKIRMKNILTLLVCSLFVRAAFAQTDAQKEEAKRVILGPKKTSTSTSKTGDDKSVILGGGDNRTVYGETDPHYPQRYPSTSTSREQRIYDINRTYDAKIASVRNNPTLSRAEKERIIRQLEADRRRRIDAVNGSYHGKDRRNDDDDDHDDYKKHQKAKGNNGNHYGWEKGKGNPHKED